MSAEGKVEVRSSACYANQDLLSRDMTPTATSSSTSTLTLSPLSLLPLTRLVLPRQMELIKRCFFNTVRCCTGLSEEESPPASVHNETTPLLRTASPSLECEQPQQRRDRALCVLLLDGEGDRVSLRVQWSKEW